MGGRGNSSKINTGSRTGSTAENQERQINRTSFTNDGFGQWTLDIEGVGGISILDERDSSRAGFGSGPAYSISVWGADYAADPDVIMYGSLNEAKRRAKELLKEKVRNS